MKDLRPAIRRALVQRSQTKAHLVAYLGAQDAWDRVDHALQQLRKAGDIEYTKRGQRWGGSTFPDHKRKVWQLTKQGFYGTKTT